MRKKFRRQSFDKKPEDKSFRINEQIPALELVVIDHVGAPLGVMSKDAALALAQERELDLVEVSPKAVPPVAKIMDFGSFKYQQEKKERKQRAQQKTVEIKTIKVSPRIGDHDLDVRVNQGLKFLADGNKVKIELQLRGREHHHVDVARETISEVIAALKAQSDKDIKVEQPIDKQGSKLSTIITF